ncbi:MAG: asparagine synthase (glutamine-hydrolyzing) [Candidatus Magasanikbacteria bacterium]|nr:asparagine synthase (glutamine-hydrolyzing) [Candidatus Magasanikbacteria bacterium]
MCGINGFNFYGPELIQRMNHITRHRGPDQNDFFAEQAVSFGFNRLAIIDLSERASQPMWDEKKEIVIVYNGELYNFKEIREELKTRYSFRSESDTEVVLYAYREWGIDCLKRFNGMFAFAIWDKRTGDLWLARDQMGIKPLYYYFDNTRFIFSSEIKGILEHGVPRSVDPVAFNMYAQILYIPEPLTMFEGIKKLPAAHYLRLDANKRLSILRYWQVDDFVDTSLTRKEAREQILFLFKESIRRQLVSDRPLGIFLSGGIDSTAVLGAVSESARGKIKTFSVGFEIDHPESKKFNADFLLAKLSAAYYGTEHFETRISARDVLEHSAHVVSHLGEPNANPTAFAQFLLSRAAKQEVAVVLGGDGGDELFGGYPRYYYSFLLSHYYRLPHFFRRSFENFLRLTGKQHVLKKLGARTGMERWLAFFCQKTSLAKGTLAANVFRPNGVARHLAERFGEELKGEEDLEKHLMNVDRQSWLVDESLFRTDAMTMAWGLEERVPILDKHLVEFAAKIPSVWKMHLSPLAPSMFKGKDIWRETLKSYIPERVLNQKKRGWFTPMAKWMRHELRDFVGDIISPGHLNTDFFDPKALNILFEEHVHSKAYHVNILYAAFMWQLWYDTYIKK